MKYNLVGINKILIFNRKIRKQINESVGIFIFLTISSIFLNTCLHVTLFVTVDTKTNHLFPNSANFIILSFLILMMVFILSLISNENNVFIEFISSLKKKRKLMTYFCSIYQIQNNLFILKTILFKLIYCPPYV